MLSFDYLFSLFVFSTTLAPVECAFISRAAQMDSRFHPNGTWDYNKNLSKFHHQYLTARKEHHSLDLNGQEMKVATNNFVGFFELGGKHPENQIYSGVDFEIVKALSSALNFTYKVVTPADGLWGNPLPDGKITGLIGLVARWEADFAICAVAVSELRERVVDFTYPYHQEPLAIFTRAPKTKNRALAVLSPFTLQIWLCIIASTIITGLLLKVQTEIANAFLEKNFNWTMSQCLFNIFRNLMIQGNYLKTTYWPHRLLFFSWLMFCLIISAMYSGMLTAVLAIPAFETPVNSLEDLPRAIKDGFTLGILKDSTNARLFEEAKEGIYSETWKLFNHEEESESFIIRPEDGINRILKSKYLFIGFKISNEILISQLGERKFHVGLGAFFFHGIGIACPPGAQYKDAFSRLLMMMVENGLILKWFRNEIDKVSQKAPAEAEKSGATAINLTHLQAAFFVVVLGSVFAAMVFCLEIIASYVNTPRSSSYANSSSSSC